MAWVAGGGAGGLDVQAGEWVELCGEGARRVAAVPVGGRGQGRGQVLRI